MVKLTTLNRPVRANKPRRPLKSETNVRVTIHDIVTILLEAKSVRITVRAHSQVIKRKVAGGTRLIGLVLQVIHLFTADERVGR